MVPPLSGGNALTGRSAHTPANFRPPHAPPMNADSDASGFAYEDLTEAERFALELRWYDGSMLPYFEWLMVLIEDRRAEIVQRANGSAEPAALIDAVKRVIAECGSLHMAAEMKAQREEIEKELWCQGQKGRHDRAKIKQEWAQRYGADWRRWRVREYLFVVDRCAERIVEVLRFSADDPPSAVSQ